MTFIDDIVLIDGIGDKTAEGLRAEGIASLTALVALSAEELTALEEKLGVVGQAEREEWVVQANEMISGQPPRAKVDQDLVAKMKKEAASKEGGE